MENERGNVHYSYYSVCVCASMCTFVHAGSVYAKCVW